MVQSLTAALVKSPNLMVTRDRVIHVVMIQFDQDCVRKCMCYRQLKGTLCGLYILNRDLYPPVPTV